MKLGIIGGGQLARMLALAAAPLGIEVTCLEPNPQPTRGLCQVIERPYDDPAALQQLLQADAVTFEFENVPPEALDLLEHHPHVFPHPRALRASQDRAQEKTFLQGLGIEAGPWLPVDNDIDLQQALTEIGQPGILKTRRLGYDGKGQKRFPGAEPTVEAPSVYEKEVPFTRELSCLAARSRSGAIAWYPLTENVHAQGILRRSRPIDDPALQARAQALVAPMLEALDYVGVLALELFQVGDRLLANEFAPRVHNSGHWTQNGCRASQFENHLRAIFDLPLGETEVCAPCAMVNLIGSAPPAREILEVPGAHLHLYNKSFRPGRKVGHVNLLASTPDELDRRLARLQEIV